MSQRPEIFLSYARENLKIVNIVEGLLQEVGFQPWVDRQQLIGGQQWADAIQQTLDQCSLVVVLVTPAALESDYVRREYLTARGQGKPIVLLRCQPVKQLPPELADAPIIDYRGNRDRARYDLLDAIDRLGVRPKADGFDGFLAIARAYHGRAEPDWQVFTATRAAYLRVLPIELLQLLAASALAYFGFTILDQSNFFLSYVGPLFFGVAFVYLSRFYRLCLQANGYHLPEMLVITPQGVAIRNVRFHSFQQFRVPRYPFLALESMSLERRWFTFPAEYFLLADPKTTVTKRYSIFIHRRLGDTKTIATAIADAFARFQPVAPAQAAVAEPPVAHVVRAATPTAPHPMPPVALSTASGVAPQVFMCAASQDRRFVANVQRSLANRQIQWAANQTEQAAIDASGVVLLVASRASLAAPEVQRQYRYALSRGKPVIPLLTQPRSQLPGELQTLQWIDCSNPQQQERWRADLLIALAAMGVTQPAGTFDGELALAHAMRNHLPPGYTGFVVQPEAYQRSLRTAIRNAITTSLYMLFLAFFALAIFIGVLVGILADHEYTVANYVGGVVALLVVFGVWFLPVFFIRQARMLRRLQRQIVMPEIVVVGPDGIAAHRASQRYLELTTAVYPFATTSDIVLYRLLGNPSALGMKDGTGKISKIRLRGFVDANAVATAALAAFKASRRVG